MRKCVREDAIEDRLQKLVVIGIEIAILTMICVSLFWAGLRSKRAPRLRLVLRSD
jgi:hypothetical protein